MDRLKYFQEQAAQCRSLAKTITTREDPTKEHLEYLAKEFEELAKIEESQSKKG